MWFVWGVYHLWRVERGKIWYRRKYKRQKSWAFLAGGYILVFGSVPNEGWGLGRRRVLEYHHRRGGSTSQNDEKPPSNNKDVDVVEKRVSGQMFPLGCLLGDIGGHGKKRHYPPPPLSGDKHPNIRLIEARKVGPSPGGQTGPVRGGGHIVEEIVHNNGWKIATQQGETNGPCVGGGLIGNGDLFG